MMPIDRINLTKLSSEYTLEAILRLLADVHGEETLLAALAETLEEKGIEEKCSGCRAAAQVLNMLSHDDAQRPYVTGGGVRCPNVDCESNNIEGGSFDTEKGVVTQNLVCYTCGTSWVDEYILIGYRDFEEGSSQFNHAYCSVCGECMECNNRPCRTDDGIHVP